MSKSTKDKQEITSLRWINQNKHFMVCTNEGFAVCDATTADPKVVCKIPGGVALCDSYKNSNIFFVVGTGKHIDFPSTKLCLWNAQSNSLAGSVQFSPTNQIVDLQVKGDWILVVFKNSFKLFNFESGFKQDQVVVE